LKDYANFSSVFLGVADDIPLLKGDNSGFTNCKHLLHYWNAEIRYAIKRHDGDTPLKLSFYTVNKFLEVASEIYTKCHEKTFANI
jgi:hypothetical protein